MTQRLNALQSLTSQRALHFASRSCTCRQLSVVCSAGAFLGPRLLASLACASLGGASRRKARTHARDPNSFGHPARRATDCLLVANAACFAAQYLFNGKLVKWGIKDNAAIMAGQWWRLLTSAFLHGNLLHFCTNAYSLNNVGPFMESLAGSRRFLSVYALSAAGGCLLSYFLSPSYALGASGAIFGILGSLSVFLVRHRTALGTSVADSTLRSLLQVCAINLVIGLTPGIDNWGHLGGLAGGAAASYLLGPSWHIEGKTLHDRPPLRFLAHGPRQMQ